MLYLRITAEQVTNLLCVSPLLCFIGINITVQDVGILNIHTLYFILSIKYSIFTFGLFVSFQGYFSLLILSLVLGTQTLTPTHHLTTSDVARLQGALSQPFTDLKSVYYSVVGLSKLGIFVADADVRKNDFFYYYLLTFLCIW